MIQPNVTQQGRNRWLVSINGGQLCFLEDEAQLRELVARGQVTAATAVYEVAAGSRALADVPELARLLPRKRRASLSIVSDHEPDAMESLDRELTVLDRPLPDEVEYYDERPPRTWRAGATGLVLTLLCGGVLLLALGHARVETTIIQLVASGRAAVTLPARADAPAAPPIAKPAQLPVAAVVAPAAGPTAAKPPAQLAPAAPAPPEVSAPAPERSRGADRARAHHSRSRSDGARDRAAPAGHGKRARPAARAARSR